MTESRRLLGLLVLTVFLFAAGGCAMFEPAGDEEQVAKRQEKIKTLREKKEQLEAKTETQKKQLVEKETQIREHEAKIEELEARKKQLEKLKQENAELAESLDEIKQAETRREGKNVIVSLDAEILFDFGAHKLRPQARKSLDELASVIEEYSDRRIVVEGHTDTVPVLAESRFPSNWHLSAARAVSVVEYLVEKQDLPPEQFFAGGYGEHHPVKPNTTEANRARNRRVEINFLPPKLEEEVIQPEK